MASDASAVAIVTPAEGPSFGIAPAGTCTWISCRMSSVGSTPSASSRQRTQVSAVWPDSFITSPSWPVSTSPRPRVIAASMRSTSPPASVHATPFATPTSGLWVGSSPAWRGGPSQRESVRRSTRISRTSPSAARRATLRHTVATWRSRFRTPASNV